ncbi:hypothetical protein ACFOLJ_22615 [Rugamonas sp. CCM 8940]|nr:hypothetical protein [Rugamonas sp. CCM 8940]MBJ7312557.1 hypothetical protein [Rugamonas sp. CCM 8940]
MPFIVHLPQSSKIDPLSAACKALNKCLRRSPLDATDASYRLQIECD